MADNYHPLPEDSAGLPYSLEAEQAVLGSILVDPDCLTLIQSEGFQADYFYLPQHRLIYGSILQLQTTGGVIDPLLVVEKLRESDS